MDLGDSREDFQMKRGSPRNGRQMSRRIAGHNRPAITRRSNKSRSLFSDSRVRRPAGTNSRMLFQTAFAWARTSPSATGSRPR